MPSLKLSKVRLRGPLGQHRGSPIAAWPVADEGPEVSRSFVDSAAYSGFCSERANSPKRVGMYMSSVYTLVIGWLSRSADSSGLGINRGGPGVQGLMFRVVGHPKP